MNFHIHNKELLTRLLHLDATLFDEEINPNTIVLSEDNHPCIKKNSRCTIFDLACALKDYTLDWNQEHERTRFYQNFKNHKSFKVQKRIDYSIIPHIPYNHEEDDEIENYLWEDEIADLLQEGVRKEDIELTNQLIRHNEKKSIELLKSGASPYLITSELREGKTADKKKCLSEYLFPAIITMIDEVSYSERQYGAHLWGSPKELEVRIDDSFAISTAGVFIAGASNRMLHLITKFIHPDLLAQGKTIELLCWNETSNWEIHNDWEE